MIRQMLIERPVAEAADAQDSRYETRKGRGNDCREGGRRQSANTSQRHHTINLAESPLGWLHAHGRVTDQQFAAGELLRRDYERAGLPAHVTMQWDAGPLDGNRRDGSSAHAAHAGQIDARKRFHAAMDVAGPGLADVLWRVICAGDSLPLAEKYLDWPTRSAKLVLALALDRVAAYYRVP